MPTSAMKTTTGAKQLSWQFWQGQRLGSSRECPLAFDTQVGVITDERQIPRLALAAASDGRTHVLIHPDQLDAFLFQHRRACFVGHNVQSDFWVVDQHLSVRGDPRARRVLWDACDEGRLFDTQILDMLLQLATGNFRHAAGVRSREAKVYPGHLSDVAVDYTTLRLNKDDPYRQCFGELIGRSREQWAGVDPGFFASAIQDAVATRRLYPALAHRAYDLMVASGFDRRAQRYDIRPDALEQFGYLSEILQVQASVVLAYLFRRGVRINLVKARTLEAKYRGELEALIAELERSFPEVLTYDADGGLVLTPTSKTPSLGTHKLQAMLLQVADEIRRQGHEPQLPLDKGEQKGVSLAVRAWRPYAAHHPFLQLWLRLSKLEKLLGFLSHLTAERLHGEYALLMRTGRTSCSRPRSDQLPGLNIQQMPSLAEFRALFEPDPGCKLFVGDFTLAEFRTLAAVCRARFGVSRLGEIIAADIDTHDYTAAAIEGLSLEAFEKLKESEPQRYKEARKLGKSINFAVAGGMGAESLRADVWSTSRIALSLEQAQQFRHQLIREVYPELKNIVHFRS
jgi:hypothetical protein